MKITFPSFCSYLAAIIVITFSSTGMAADPSNTQLGNGALHSNMTGTNDTAIGESALYSNNSGVLNTAIGAESLYSNTNGYSNVATGAYALYANTMGLGNTATGTAALKSNTTGSFNTASGPDVLYFNSTGSSNTAAGLHALLNNTTGAGNTALGVNALGNATTANGNIGLGIDAGLNLTAGSNNIDIGSPGAAGESRTTHIGTQGAQTATFIAGVFGSTVTGDLVVVNNKGKLGIMTSSARYKRDIQDMHAVSNNLMKLRPVTFRYRNDPAGTRQYGLIAEEVARLYPELVAVGADGRVETVHYQELIPMLLNELQKQARQQAEQNRKLAAQVVELKAAQEHQRVAFEQQLTALERTLAATDGGKLAAAFRR